MPQIVEEEFSDTWFRIFNAIAWDALSGATSEKLLLNVWRLAPKGTKPKDAKGDWRRIATQLLANELIDVRSELRPQRPTRSINSLRFKAIASPPEMRPENLWYLTEKGKRLYAIVNAVPYRGVYEAIDADA